MATPKTPIAELLLKLSVEVEGMEKGLKGAESKISKFSSTAKKLLGGIGAGLAVRSIVNGINEIYAAAAKVGYVSQRLGLMTKDFAGLASVAKGMKIPVEAIATSMKFLNRNMAQAAQGTGNARAAFDALGIKVKDDITGKTAEANEVVLQIADAFSRMSDSALRTEYSLRIFGRGGDAMTDMLLLGREELERWIKENERFGVVVNDDFAEAAKRYEFLTMSIGNAIKGIKIAIAEALLPTITSISKMFLALVDPINQSRDSIAGLVLSIKYLIVALTPLLLLGVAKFFLDVAKSIQVLSVALASLKAILSLGALLNPITLLALGLGVVAAGMVYLSDRAKKAEVSLKAFKASLKGMSVEEMKAKLKELQTELDATISRFDEMAKRDKFWGKWGNVPNQTEEVKLLKEEIKALESEIAKAGRGEIVPVTSVDDIEKVRDKIDELRAATVALRDPAAGARIALDAFVKSVLDGKKPTAEMEAELKNLVGAFQQYQRAQEALANAEARRTGNLNVMTAQYEAQLSALERHYEAGLVGLGEYYDERIRITKDKVGAEVAALNDRLKDAKTTAERLEIQAQIQVKGIELEKSVFDTNAEMATKIRELQQYLGQALFQGIISENEDMLADVEDQYQRGLLSVENYFRRRREIADNNLRLEVASYKKQMETSGPQEAQELQDKITAAEEKAARDRINSARDEVTEKQAAMDQMIDLSLSYQAKREQIAQGELARIEEGGKYELEELRARNAQELRAIETSANQRFLIEGELVSKEEALRKMRTAQVAAESKKIVDIEEKMFQTRMSMAQQATTSLGEIFSNLYELSGRKVRAYFYLQKVAAIAEAIINTAVAATSALKMGPVIGPIMAKIVTALGATQIAMITAQRMKKGGPVRGGSGTKDDVPIMAMAGEYVMPKNVVQYYGAGFLEALRRMVIPRDKFAGLPRFPALMPGYAFASGGMVAGTAGPSVSLNIVNNSGVALTADQPTTKFDGKRWVIETVIDAMNRNVGGMRQAMRGGGR